MGRLTFDSKRLLSLLNSYNTSPDERLLRSLSPDIFDLGGRGARHDHDHYGNSDRHHLASCPSTWFQSIFLVQCNPVQDVIQSFPLNFPLILQIEPP